MRRVWVPDVTMGNRIRFRSVLQTYRNEVVGTSARVPLLNARSMARASVASPLCTMLRCAANQHSEMSLALECITPEQ
jgi:hypothetical protein